MNDEEDEERYRINKEFAHPKAIELIPDEFFWDCVDELAPFGSDEGDMALAEYREWRKENPDKSIIDCLIWVIEDVGEMDFKDFNDTLLDRNLIKSQLNDDNYDSEQYIFTLDISVIATGFAQLVDEGKIDDGAKPIINLAIDREIISSELMINWEYSEEYINNLKKLKEVLEKV